MRTRDPREPGDPRDVRDVRAPGDSHDPRDPYAPGDPQEQGINIINVNVAQAQATTGRSAGLRERWVMIVVLAACLVHYVWGVLLLIPGLRPERSTPVSALFSVFGIAPADAATHPLTAAWVITVATVALYGVFQRHHLIALLALLPQQLLLGISAWGAMSAMWWSHYADGVVRDRGFIIADQIPTIALWLAHSATLIVLYALYRIENHVHQPPTI